MLSSYYFNYVISSDPMNVIRLLHLKTHMPYLSPETGIVFLFIFSVFFCFVFFQSVHVCWRHFHVLCWALSALLSSIHVVCSLFSSNVCAVQLSMATVTKLHGMISQGLQIRSNSFLMDCTAKYFSKEIIYVFQNFSSSPSQSFISSLPPSQNSPQCLD